LINGDYQAMTAWDVLISPGKGILGMVVSWVVVSIDLTSIE